MIGTGKILTRRQRGKYAPPALAVAMLILIITSNLRPGAVGNVNISLSSRDSVMKSPGGSAYLLSGRNKMKYYSPVLKKVVTNLSPLPPSLCKGRGECK